MNTSDRRHGFPRDLRLTSQRDFALTYAAKVRRQAGPLLVFARPNGRAHPRLGLSIGRRVGNAPTRVRLKRMLRESFRLLQHDLPGAYDLIVVARQHVPLTLDEYRSLLTDAVSLLHRDWQRQDARRARGPEGASP